MGKVYYGKKKLIGSFEKGKTECDLPSGVAPADLPKTVKQGYLLVSGSKDELQTLRDRRDIYAPKTLKAERCFCTECQKAFDLDSPISIGGNRYTSLMSPIGREHTRRNDDEGYKYGNVLDVNESKVDTDISCPECHTKMETLGAVIPIAGAPMDGHVNKNGAWIIPEEITGRYLFEYRNEEGKLTRLDDNFMTRSTLIYPSGKEFHYNAEYSKANDLIKHAEMTTKTALIGSERTPVIASSAVDVYEYAKAKTPMQKESPVHARIGAKNGYFDPNSKPNFDTDIIECCMDPLYDTKSMTEFNHSVRGMKLKQIEQAFTLPDPIMNDSSRNCMYLRDVKADSTERNTTHVDERKDRYMTLMTKYPAAFEFAAKRANDRAVNYEFEQKRKADADPNYTAKAPTDKYKAKLMREEMSRMAEQLSTCDDKILQTIRESNGYTDMVSRLRAVSLGDLSGLDENAKMGIGVQNAKTESFSGKKLKKAFNLDPIATAHNVYTAKKIGLKTIDDINALNEIAKEKSPELNPAPVRIKGKYKQPSVQYNEIANAGMVAPIRTQNQMRFMRNFSNTHSPSDVLEMYSDKDKFELCNECLDMYNKVCEHTVLLDNEKAKDPAVATAMHEFVKNNIADYLQHHSVQDAYINYVTKYGAKTPGVINQYIAEIKFDDKIPEIRQYAAEHGQDAAVKKYSDEYKANKYETSDADFWNRINDIESYIQSRIDDKYEKLLNGKQIVTTKNEKPLFNNRTLREIHDELSNINKKMVTENYDLSDCYPDDIKAMQKDYPAPDGSGTWKFRCHKNAFDVVNSATALHNCLGSSHVDNMRYGSMWVLYMENELGHRVAAIELKKNWGSSDMKYSVNQFQSDHDTALPARYADVARQWLTECNIDHKNNSNVQAFGKEIAFYGGGNADYHYHEIDEIENEEVTVDERAKRQMRRLEEAKRLYNYDEATNTWNFGVEIPEYKVFKELKTPMEAVTVANSTPAENPTATNREIIDVPAEEPTDNNNFSL